jgi:hypothetical protein
MQGLSNVSNEPLFDSAKQVEIGSRLIQADRIRATFVVMVCILNGVILPKTDRAYIKRSWRPF